MNTDAIRGVPFAFRSPATRGALWLGIVFLLCLPLSSQAAQDFVVLGEEGIWVREGSTVVSGDVGANVASAGPWLASDQEVTFGENVIVQDGSVANSEMVKNPMGFHPVPD